MTMEHELIPIPSRYRFLLHLLAGMCIGILANCSDSNLDLYSIQTFLGDINRLVFNNFFDEEMKKVDEIVLNQANNRRNNQNNKHMEIKIKKCNDVRNYDIHDCGDVYISTDGVKVEKKKDSDRVVLSEMELYAASEVKQYAAPEVKQYAAPDGMSEPGGMHHAAPTGEMKNPGNLPKEMTVEVFAQAVVMLMGKKDEHGKPIVRYQKQWIGIFRAAVDIGLVGNTDYEGFCHMMNEVRPEGYPVVLCKNDIKKISNSSCYFKPFKQWSFEPMGNETVRPFMEMKKVVASLFEILNIEL